MPITQCRTCGNVVDDPSRPCPSCGNFCGQPPKPSAQSFVQSPVFNNGDASKFSVGVVLSRSFSTFFKHPFVFVGLSFLGQIPGLVVMAFTQDSEGIAWIISMIFGLIFQGAIAYGVYEALRGGNAQFGKSLSRGLARFIPLLFTVLSCVALLALLLVGVTVLGIVVSPFINLLIPLALLTTLAILVLTCKWYVSVPVCVVERLGPIQSLNRSSILTKGCRLKIGGLFLLFFVIAFTVIFVFRFVAGIVGVGGGASSVIEQFINVVPMVFAHIVTAVTYYELRNVKEGVTIDSLANVFD